MTQDIAHFLYLRAMYSSNLHLSSTLPSVMRCHCERSEDTISLVFLSDSHNACHMLSRLVKYQPVTQFQFVQTKLN